MVKFNNSKLCSTCRRKVKMAFSKDEDGIMTLNGTPKVCSRCAEAMKHKMQEGRYTR